LATRRVIGDEPGHGQALGQVCCAGLDVLGITSSLEALSAGQRTKPPLSEPTAFTCTRPRAQCSAAALRRTRGRGLAHARCECVGAIRLSVTCAAAGRPAQRCRSAERGKCAACATLRSQDRGRIERVGAVRTGGPEGAREQGHCGQRATETPIRPGGKRERCTTRVSVEASSRPVCSQVCA
jgi:hypothetical protein